MTEDMNTGLTFDTSDLTFETDDPVLNTVLNVGVRVGIVSGGVVLGTGVCYVLRKGFDWVCSLFENGKAANVEKKAEEKKAEEPEVVNADGTAAN